MTASKFSATNLVPFHFAEFQVAEFQIAEFRFRKEYI